MKEADNFSAFLSIRFPSLLLHLHNSLPSTRRFSLLSRSGICRCPVYNAETTFTVFKIHIRPWIDVGVLCNTSLSHFFLFFFFRSSVALVLPRLQLHSLCCRFTSVCLCL